MLDHRLVWLVLKIKKNKKKDKEIYIYNLSVFKKNSKSIVIGRSVFLKFLATFPCFIVVEKHCEKSKFEK